MAARSCLFWQVRSHPFLASIDLEALHHKQITPPYVPSCSDAFDTSSFDPEIDPDSTGDILLGLQAEPYPANTDEWDADF